MERICADCRFFRVTEPRDEGSVGRCRLEQVIGVFRDSMRACPRFSRQGDPDLPAPSTGRRRTPTRRASTISRPIARPTVSASSLAEALQTLESDALKQALVDAVSRGPVLPSTELARGWVGSLALAPADASLKSKDIELEQLFHKMVMIRDYLRVLEQKLNSRDDLSAGEKLDLQGRLTRCHTSVLNLAAGWVPRPAFEGMDPTAQGLLSRLVREVEWAGLALPPPTLGDRWHGGRARYGAGDDLVDEPIEAFFHRLVVMRDRFLALEAVLGAHGRIAAGDYAQLSGYIRRCFGTLTTFNVLFKDRGDYFSSKR